MNNKIKITNEMLIGDVLKIDPSLSPILAEIGMHCLGCPSAQHESLADACMVHNVSVNEVVDKLNAKLGEVE